MEHLEKIKESLILKAYEQLEKLDCVKAKELGEVIDMIKDIEEAEYYHVITEAMKNTEE